MGTGVVEGFCHNLSHCCLSGQGHVDEEFISREAFGIALLKRGFVVVVEVGCRSVMEFTSCRVTWLTRGRRTG